MSESVKVLVFSDDRTVRESVRLALGRKVASDLPDIEVLEVATQGALLRTLDLCGAPFDMMHTSFFLSRQTLLASAKPGMAIWREKLFAWMLRNAASAMEFFRLPTNRVVELGSQVEI